MPTNTLPISLRTLPIGDTTFGPLNVSNSSILAQITSDRTVAGGMNSLTAASTLAVLIQSSTDGVTWKDEAGGTWVGGIYISRVGQLNTDNITVHGIDPAANKARIVTTVAGPTSIVFAGTITVST